MSQEDNALGNAGARWDQLDPDKFSRLFDAACDETALSSLPLADQADARAIRELLDIIDAGWTSEQEQRDRIFEGFLRRLAEEEPSHAWVRSRLVNTLGDLVRVDQEVPALPPAVQARLLQDETPLEELRRPGSRTAALGRAVRHAGVPADRLTPLMLWLNRTIPQLFPTAGPAGQLMFARRQRPGRAASGPPPQTTT
jgi:hypothetical protein